MLTLLVPDIALIALGLALQRGTGWGQAFWDGLERLNYTCLFPCLLFVSITRNPVRFDVAGPMLAGALIVIAAGFALAVAARPLLHPPALRLASSGQCAYRFNTIIVLAMAARVGGQEAAALAAMCVGVGVPLCNVLAVSSLARHGERSFLRELVSNPLVIATAVATLAVVSGLAVPDALGDALERLASAAIALGLISVGAALTWRGARGDRPLMAWIVASRALALPALVLALGPLLGLDGTPLMALMIFAAAPTATSSYILTSRMGGDGAYVALVVTASTLACMVTAPLWMTLVR